MSQKKLIDFFVFQCQNLSAIGREDAQIVNGGPYSDRKKVEAKIKKLFVRYVMISNNLREIADEIKNPIQKNIIRKTYEVAVSRALQLHYELTRLLWENFINVDKELIQKNVTPFDIKLKLPYYLKKKGWHRTQNIHNWFEENNLSKKLDSLKSESRNASIIMKEEKIKNSNEILIPVSQLEKDFNAKKKNYVIQKINSINYKESILKTADELKNKYHSKIEEAIEDEIIEWIDFFFSKTGQLPVFPPKDFVFATGQIFGGSKKLSKETRLRLKAPNNIPNDTFSQEFAGLPKFNGSQLVVNNNWIGPDDWLSGKNKKQIKTREVKVKKPKADKKMSGFKLQATDYFSIMNLLKLKQLRSLNCNVEDDIKLNAMVEVGIKIRAAVDEMMREELKAKKKKKQKKKKGKRKGKKGASQPTPENCKEQLAKCGVLKQANNCNLYDYDGEYPSDVRCRFDGELLDFLHNRCILPLCSSAIHYFAPLTRSICLLGPENSEGKYLLDILVTETGSTLFDLSPAVTADIFPGKKGIKKLISLVGGLAREMQPSIIFLADVDKIFPKKVAKSDKKLNTKRLQPFLSKFIKRIKKSDRILILATAREPWLAKSKKIVKLFDNFLYIPSSNYGTHILAWQHLLNTNVDMKTVAALAKTAFKEKYSYHNAENAVKSTDLVENIIDNLAENHSKVEDKFIKFLKITPLGKSKMKMEATDKMDVKAKKIKK